MELGKVWVTIEANADKLNKAMSDAQKKVEMSTKKMSDSLKSVGKSMTIIGAGMTTAMIGTFKTFTDYESALTDMGKVTDQTSEEIEKAIKGIDPVLGNMTQLVQGYYQVISAGVTEPVEALDLLTTAAQTAKAAHVSQDEAVRALTKMMAGFGDEMKTTSDAADLLFGIEKEGQTTVAELVPIIGGLATMSHNMAVSGNEMGAALALITQTAASSAEAATQYEGILNALIKPTDTMVDLIKSWGYETASQAIEAEGFADVLKRIKEEVGDNEQALGDLFGRKEAIVGFLALATDGFSKFDETIKDVSDSTGSASKAFNNWSQTGQASMDAMYASLSNLSIIAGETFAPMIKQIIDKISELIPKIKDWIENNRPLIEIIGKLGIVLAVGGPVLVGLGMLVGAITSLMNPIGLVVVAVTGLVTAWTTNFLGIRDTTQKVWDTVKNIFSNIINEVDNIINAFKNMYEWGKNAISGFVQGIEDGIAKIKEVAGKIGNTLKGFLGFESPPKEGPLSDSDKWMPNMMDMFADGIVSSKAGLTAAVKTTASIIKQVKDETEEVIKSSEKLSEVGSKSWNEVSGAVEKTRGVMQSAADAFASWNSQSILSGMGSIFDLKPRASMASGGQVGGMAPSYQSGTNYVPKTGLYKLHQGEAVIPANQNTYNNSFSPTVNLSVQGGNATDIAYEIEKTLNNMSRNFRRG